MRRSGTISTVLASLLALACDGSESADGSSPDEPRAAGDPAAATDPPSTAAPDDAEPPGRRDRAGLHVDRLALLRAARRIVVLLEPGHLALVHRARARGAARARGSLDELFRVLLRAAVAGEQVAELLPRALLGGSAG